MLKKEEPVVPDEVFKSGQSGESAPMEITGVLAARHTKTEVGPAGPEKIVLQGQKHENPYRMAGTLEGWQKTIGLWAQANSRLMFFLSAALSALLLELMGAESWGVNLYGGTSCAKTTTLQVAATVWGSGGLTGGYVKSWRSTDNGLEGEAEMHNDTALCLDELGQASARTLNEASYMLFNSMGKGRASRNGDSKPRKRWRTVALSTGEKTLAARMAEEGMRPNPGQSVRLIELPADAGKGLGAFENLHGHASAQEFADTIKSAATQNYGHAGRAFVAKLVENKAEITAWLQGWMRSMLKEFCSEGATGQVKRGAQHFMLAAAAGELAARLSIVPWKEGEALEAAKKCFSAWIASRGGNENEAEEETRIVGDVKRFLEMHGSSRFQRVDGSMDAVEKTVNRVGFVKTESGKTTYYCLPEAFKNEICKGHDYKLAQRVLAERGMLIKDGKNYTVKPPRLPEIDRQRVYAFVMPADEERPDSPDSGF